MQLYADTIESVHSYCVCSNFFATTLKSSNYFYSEAEIEMDESETYEIYVVSVDDMQIVRICANFSSQVDWIWCVQVLARKHDNICNSFAFFIYFLIWFQLNFVDASLLLLSFRFHILLL